MAEVEGIIRKWGNSSLAFVIPKEIAKREKLKPNQKLRAILIKQDNVLARTFGILKDWKKPTAQILRETDKELWPED